MGMKLGTKAFAPATEKPTSTINAPQTMSATETEKLGGADVGEQLNKLADPNYIDPKKKVRAVGNDKLDKDAFFKLMLAQMKNQDPTNPLKPHEMSAQLATFSGLEQMTNTNTILTEMKNGQKPTEQFQALSLIGKAVAGDSAHISRAKGDKDHDIRFDLPMASGEVEIKVKNSEGEAVRTYSLKNLKAGPNKVTWNGLDEKGTPTHPDEYSVTIEAKNGDKKIAVKTDFEGVITGVNYTPEGPVMLVGNQTVRLKDVKKIVDPSLMKNDQKVQNAVPQDLKEAGAPQQTEKESTAGAPDVAKKKSILDTVGLSSAMMQKVQKETGAR